MGLRVRKSIKLGKHVKLNVWKNGVSYHVPNNKNTKVKTKISTPVRTQQKTMPIETKHILIKYRRITQIMVNRVSVHIPPRNQQRHLQKQKLQASRPQMRKY